LKVNHNTAFCLVDTGAVASCVSENFAKILKLKPQPASQEVNLTSANSSPIESTGVIDVELSIQGLTVPFMFYVLR
jgi:predicted aspartyl protease